MNIPNYLEDQFVDKNGRLSDPWKQILMQLFTQMQSNLSDEGYKVPQQGTDTINQLNTTQSTGALLYDNQTHELKVNINGEFKTVQTA
jgi:hypothetical protein